MQDRAAALKELREAAPMSDPRFRMYLDLRAARAYTMADQLKGFDYREMAPVIGAGFTAANAQSDKRAAAAFEAGTATREQAIAVADAARSATFMADVTSIGQGSIGFMGDIAVSGGLAGGARGALAAGMRAGPTRAAARLAHPATKAATALGALEGVVRPAQEALLPEGGRVSATEARMATRIGLDDAGLLTAQVDDVSDYRTRALMDTAIEDISEFTGGLVAGPAAKLALKTTIGQWWAKKTGGTIGKFFRETADKVKWNNIAGEWFEEQVGAAARGATSVLPEDKRLSEDFLSAFPDLRENAAMIAAFSMFPIAGGGISMAANALGGRGQVDVDTGETSESTLDPALAATMPEPKEDLAPEPSATPEAGQDVSVAVGSGNGADVRTKTPLVDSDGQPVVLYHGSPAGAVTQLRPSEDGAAGPGVYLAIHPRKADAFAGPSGSVYPVRIRGQFKTIGGNRLVNAREDAALAREEGYDGVSISGAGEYLVFDPADIDFDIPARATPPPVSGTSPDLASTEADSGAEGPERGPEGAFRTVAQGVKELGGIDLRGLGEKNEAGDFWERLKRREQGKAGFPAGMLYGPKSRAKAKGIPPELMVQALQEAGFEVDGTDGLLEALENELAGNPTLHPGDVGGATEAARQADLERGEQPIPEDYVEVGSRAYPGVPKEEYTREEHRIARIGQTFGTKVRFVETDDFAGVSLRPGEVVLRRGDNASRYLWHELTHDLSRRTGSVEALIARVLAVDAQGLRKAHRRDPGLWRAYGRTRGREETMAAHAEGLAAYLELLGSEKGARHIKRLMRTDRGLVERILDALRAIGAKVFGGEALTRYERDLAEATEMLRTLDPEAAPADAVSLKVAELIRRAMESGMRAEAGETADLDPRFADVWHGTGADLGPGDEFRDDKIGTGEGAQAYGHGHYFASRKGVAKWYKDQAGQAKPTDVRSWMEGTDDAGRAWVDGLASSMEGVGLSEDIYEYFNAPGTSESEWWVDVLGHFEDDNPRQAKVLRALVDAGAVRRKTRKGSLLKVTLAPKETEYLLYDERLGDQTPVVQEGLGLGQPSRAEGIPDSVTAAADRLRNVAVSDPFSSQGFGGLKVPAQRRVLKDVAAAVEHPEVLDAVVGALPVDVVDIFRGKQLSPEVALHDEAVLHDLFAGAVDHPVTTGREAPASVLVLTAARKATEQVDAARGTGLSLEGAPTGRAEAINHIRRSIDGLGQNATGWDAYKGVSAALGSDRAASQALLAAGIRGIKYLDGTSRKRAVRYETRWNKETERAEAYRAIEPSKTVKDFATFEEAERWVAEKSREESDYNYVVFDPADAKIEARFAPMRPEGKAPPYFSALEGALEGMQQKKFTALQLDRMAKKVPGVTAEELEWVGWDELIGDGRRSVTKEEALEWVRAHQVEVREKVLGDKPPQYDPDRWYVFDTRKSDSSSVADYRTAAQAREHVNNAAGVFLDYASGRDLDEQATDPVRHGSADYQLPGGENYRELLLTLPVKTRTVGHPAAGKPWGVAPAQGALGGWHTVAPSGARTAHYDTREQAERNARMQEEQTAAYRETVEDDSFTSGHYGDTPNVLAHVRFNERTDAEGRRVLFVEEIQSDWMQQGRKEGFSRPMFRVVSITGGGVLKAGGKGRAEFDTRAEAEAYAEAGPDHWSVKEIQGPGVPDAPFKTSWPALALKRAIKWAADNGFDAVSWTRGEQQIDRYETELRRVVDNHGWRTEADGGKRVYLYKDEKKVIEFKTNERGVIDDVLVGPKDLMGKPMEGVLGKKPTEAILEGEKGNDMGPLTVGGKGFEDFYDKMLVNAANKLGKRFGVKVGRGEMLLSGLYGEADRAELAALSPEAREAGMAAERRAGDAAFAHTLPLTDDMRATVRGRGFSTFAPRFASGERAKPKPRKKKKAGRKSKGAKLAERLLAPEIEENRWTRFVEEYVDKGLPAKQVVDIVSDMAGMVPDTHDPYMASLLSRGKQRDVARRLRLKYINPMTRRLRAAKIPIEDIGMYTIARTARERTQWFMDRQAAGEDLGREFDHGENNAAGMPSDEADALVEEYDAKSRAYAEVGKLYDQMNAYLLDMRLEWGLISQELHEELSNRWEHYAPLQTAEEGSHFPARSKGFTVRGPEWKKAKGRTSLPDNPYVFAQVNAWKAIERSINNDVTERMVKLLRENQGVIGTEVREVPQEEVEEALRTGRRVQLPEDTFSYKKDGKQVEVKVASAGLARAMKNLDAPVKGPFLRRMSQITRTLASLYTSYNPEFILFSNPQRDTQTALVNALALAPKDAKGVGRKIVKGAPKAAAAVFRGVEGKSRDDAWGQAYEEASQLGALSSGVMVQRDYEVSAKEIAREVERGNIAEGFAKTLEAFDRVADSTENALRLSAYRVFRDMKDSEGNHVFTKEKAALAAKEITLNFDRVGSMTSTIGSFKAFFNAGMQGARQVLLHSRSPRVARRLAALGAISAMTAVMNRIIGGDDEDGVPKWDRIPAHIKERNYILMLPGGYSINLPMPWGFGAIHAAATSAADMVAGEQTSVGDATAMTASALMSGLSPVNPGPLPQMVSPTALAPAVQVWTNQAFYGAPLMPEKSRYGREVPDSERSWASSPEAFKAAARWLNDLTGGDEFESGSILGADASISPETLEATYDAYTGGMGRILKDSLRLAATPFQDWKASRTPFLRKFVREANEWSMRADYYEALEELDALKARRGGIEGRDPVRAKDEALLPLLEEYRAGKNNRGLLTQARDAMKSAREAEGSDERNRFEAEAQKAMTDFLAKYRAARSQE